MPGGFCVSAHREGLQMGRRACIVKVNFKRDGGNLRMGVRKDFLINILYEEEKLLKVEDGT